MDTDTTLTAPPVGPSTATTAATKFQLILYARDIKRLRDSERDKTRALTAASQRLQALTADLQTACAAEQRKSRELEHAYADTVLRLTGAAQCKDEESSAHGRRVSHYGRTLALHLGLSVEAADLLLAAAPMHDIGKIGIPDQVLRKPGPLNRKEWKTMQTHAALGASLLQGSASPLLEMAREIALTHHEHWDGSGYPQGLRGEAIPLVGRLVMLVDVYDALRSRHPYKPAWDHARACTVMLQGDGRTRPGHFDPRLLAAFRVLHEEFAAIYARFCD
jgi:putative two-component system response regulator